MLRFDEAQHARDMSARDVRFTAGGDDECPNCGGDGKVGYRVGDDRPEGECETCEGSGEVSAYALDVRENGPRS